MAEIVGSLFGVTPEDYQQARQAQADKMALEFAKLDPFQSARFAIGRGAYDLAGALGGALGAQDPELQIISRRQAIARQINPTDLNSMQMGVQALAQSGDQVGAMQLAQVLRQAENDIALRSQRQAAAMASTAQAGKTEQEMAEIKRQQEAYRRFKEGQQVETPAPAAAMTAANVPVTAVATEITAPKAIFNQDAIAGINPEAQKSINIILDDAAQARARAEEFKGSARASGFINQAEQLETQAASMLAVQKRRGRPFDTGVPATNEEVNAALQELAVGQMRPTEPTAPAAVAPAAAPVSQAPSDIAAQLRALETRYDFLKSLSKVPDAQNEAAGLERRMAVLRDQLKPADVGQEREALSLQDYNKRYSQLTMAERETVNKKIADAKTQSFGADREAKSLELYEKPFLQLTQTQRAVVNKQLEDEKGRQAERGAVKVIMPGERVEAKDWLKFEEFIEKQPTFKQTASIVSSAPGVLRTIRQSTSNDFAAAALPASIAKLFDQGTLSNQDITRYASTGGLEDRLALAATRFFTGKVTSVAKAEAERFMSAIYRGALLDQRNMYVKQAQRLGYADSPNYKTTLQQIDEELAKFRPSQPAGTPAATSPAAGTPTAPRAGTTGNALVDKYLTTQ